MCTLFLRWRYKPVYVHKYSSVVIYYCMKIRDPIVRGSVVFFPVRWFNVDIQVCLQDRRQLSFIRTALSYRK